jgi:hypothetical protein
MSTKSPQETLNQALDKAAGQTHKSFISDPEALEKVSYISRNLQNRAGARLLLACTLAKIQRPQIDIRKPFTELGEHSYSGRSYDERYVGAFIYAHDLPCNPTTAFLTPALRTNPIALFSDAELIGRPRKLYNYVIQLFNDVENNQISAEDLLAETIRQLLLLNKERQQRIAGLLSELRQSQDEVPLSSEEIVNLIEQHMASPRASRLPVLVVAAAYKAAAEHLREQVLPLEHHTAADERTGALGDVEITLMDDSQVVTSYEMKMKRVTKDDVNRALQKILGSNMRIDNYIFITTDIIEEAVADYAESLYRETGGIEFAILDCIGFLRHFLHLFHRLRLQFLDNYQELVLAEPESAVRQPLKETFLNMRRTAESSSSE